MDTYLNEIEELKLKLSSKEQEIEKYKIAQQGNFKESKTELERLTSERDEAVNLLERMKVVASDFDFQLRAIIHDYEDSNGRGGAILRQSITNAKNLLHNNVNIFKPKPKP